MMWFKKNDWDEGYGYVCKQLHADEVVAIAGLGRSKKFQAGARAALESIKQLDEDRSHMMGALTAQLDKATTLIEQLKRENRKAATDLEHRSNALSAIALAIKTHIPEGERL